MYILGRPSGRTVIAALHSLLFFGAIPLLGMFALGHIDPQWLWNNHIVHAGLESLGTFASLVLVIVLYGIRSQLHGRPAHTWISASLIGMGLLDGIHAMLPAGNQFVWLHSVATLIGGLGYALVWLPGRFALNRTVALVVPLAVAVGAALVGAWSLLMPQSLPHMTAGGEFSSISHFVNDCGGVGFILGWLYFIRKQQGEHKDPENRFFAGHCLLMGVAAFVFEYSVLWDSSWWAWHMLRAIAYLCLLMFLFHVYHRDLVALKNNQESLRLAKIEADTANQAKSTFLATMSHEIRTPMNAILGAVQLLQHESITPIQKDLLEKIDISGKHLRLLLNDVLDFSKIEANRFDLESIPFSLSTLLQETSCLFALMSEEKSTSVDYCVQNTIPNMVVGDPTRFRQILFNLIGNAVKFTSGGVVETTVVETNAWDGHSEIEISVRDTGIGIEPEKLDGIFDAFSQVDASTTRRFGGTGLGLAICKRLVEAMGGEIGVESQVGRGSTFRVRLTFEVAELTENGNRDVTPVAVPSMSILLVEDEPISQFVARALLDKQGHRVDVANDGIEALEKIHAERFDLVVTDIHMPRLDGYATTRRIRAVADSRTASVPVLALTADLKRGTLERCVEAGIDAVVSKPLDMEEMSQTIANLVKQGRIVHRA